MSLEMKSDSPKIAEKKIQSSNAGEFDLRKAFSGCTGLFCVISFTMTVQLAISCGSYSGYEKPPLYGDFEAQRHWMEITVNLPLEQWYVNGTDNDLNYWGLDYPPLTAYHSYLLGKISQTINASWVALYDSRGLEVPDHKFFMRLTVLTTMWSVYVPAFLFYVFYRSTCSVQNYFAAVVLLYPGLIAIDNGHFQYNHVALGLFLISFLLLSGNHLVLGAILFVMAVHFKQMELYHALPIAIYLFFICFPLFRKSLNMTESLIRISLLIIVVTLSIFFLWVPLRKTVGFPNTILARIFPFYRGIFEDKVANFWCAVNVLIKLKQTFTDDFLVRLSAIVVLTSHFPFLTIIAWRPTSENLKKGLFLSSLSFFLFSFQVHEKSILFAAIPALLLWPQYPSSMSWFLVVSNLSIYPLCIQDGNSLHLALFLFYYVLISPAIFRLTFWKALVVNASCFIGFVLCIGILCVPAPKSLPHIFPLLVAVYGFIHFISFFFVFNFLMLKENLELWKRKKL